MACTLSGSATSTFWKKASRHSAAVASPFSGSTSATQTRAPSAEKRIAASRPMPPAAPVMTATFPSSRPMKGRSLTGQAAKDAVETIEARIYALRRLRPGEPDEDDVLGVALIGDPRVARRVQLPVHPVRIALERLLRHLVAEERSGRDRVTGLRDVDREDPVLRQQILRRIEPVAQLIESLVLHSGALQRPSRLPFELLHHLTRRDEGR